jgi:hypothetical protein
MVKSSPIAPPSSDVNIWIRTVVPIMPSRATRGSSRFMLFFALIFAGPALANYTDTVIFKKRLHGRHRIIYQMQKYAPIRSSC